MACSSENVGSPDTVRLQKYLAAAGVASRRKCEEYISAGRVEINGEVVYSQGVRVNPVMDRIKFDGKLICADVVKEYFLLNKPRGVVSTASDPQGRKKVTDLITVNKNRIYPVGRLDADTEGLLLLTNDGELTNALIHPRLEIKKTYLALVKGIPRQEQLLKLRKGVMLDDGMTAPAEAVEIVNVSEGNACIRIVIHEGRKRQVRRMCEAIGNKVIRLKRSEFCSLTLNGLKPGQYRRLTAEEIRSLKEAAGLGE